MSIVMDTGSEWVNGVKITKIKLPHREEKILLGKMLSKMRFEQPTS